MTVATEGVLDTAAASAAGVVLEDEVYEDYFGFDQKHVFYLPDGKQFIEFQTMDEGRKAKFQKMTNRDVVLERQSGNARMNVDPASERWELLKASVTGWKIMRKNNNGKFEPVPFSIGSPGAEFEKWLDKANPLIVADLEVAIRKANPWLIGEMTVEDIDKEMDNLRELREAAVKREAGNASSSSR